jgi:alpha-1,6-mannosyltransferase
MKILEVAEFYSERGGGVRTYINRKFAAATAAGHKLILIAPGPADRVEERIGGKVYWVRSPAIPFDPRYHLFWRQAPIDEIVTAENPDFIEGSSPWRGAWFAGRQPKRIAKALVIHQDPVLTYPRTLLRNLAPEPAIDRMFAWFFLYMRKLQLLFDTSIVASSWMSARLSQLGLTAPQIVPFGVNKDEFRLTRYCSDLRRQMLQSCGVCPDSGRLLITISRHHPEKRIPLMLEAAAFAGQSRPIGLFVVGDGPARHRIERLAEKYGGAYIAGFVSDRDLLSAMLASSDAYIHACPAETYGMVIGEALCAGLPLVVPSAGGAAELASESCAEFYAPDDAKACAIAITRIFARDPARLRRRALEQAAAITSTTDHFTKLFSHYETVISQRSMAGAAV